MIPAAHWLAADFDNLRNDDRRLLFYDQRGRGGSDPVKEDSLVWLDYEIDDTEAIREHFGISKISLVGWSYLSAVVALYAQAYPQFVDRLILMCPVAIRSEAEYMDEEAVEEWVKTLPCARLFLIPESGHFPHLEDPGIFFPALDVFLRGNWPEGSIEI